MSRCPGGGPDPAVFRLGIGNDPAEIIVDTDRTGRMKPITRSLERLFPAVRVLVVPSGSGVVVEAPGLDRYDARLGRDVVAGRRSFSGLADGLAERLKRDPGAIRQLLARFPARGHGRIDRLDDAARHRIAVFVPAQLDHGKAECNSSAGDALALFGHCRHNDAGGRLAFDLALGIHRAVQQRMAAAAPAGVFAKVVNCRNVAMQFVAKSIERTH